jgi:hypothetical protein
MLLSGLGGSGRSTRRRRDDYGRRGSEQLKEKVNTIALPDAEEESQAVQQSGHQNAETNPDGGDKAQSAAEAAKLDTNDAQHETPNSHNDSDQ